MTVSTINAVHGYENNNVNGGGNTTWANPSSAGANQKANGATRTFNPNSANMNWLQVIGPTTCIPPIPAGSVITGILFSCNTVCDVAGTVQAAIFNNGTIIGQKNVSPAANAQVGPFGGSTDTWGIAGLTPDLFNNGGITFGLHNNYPTAPVGGNAYAWGYSMAVYYTDPVPTPHAISASGGSNQSTTINTAFPIALYAQVMDQAGNPMSGIGVTWRLPATGASGTFPGAVKVASANTNSSGIAQSPIFTANGTAGQWSPTCEVAATPSLIDTYYETNTTPPPVPVPTSLSIVQGNSQSAVISHAFSTRLKVKLLDQFSNPLPNYDIVWTTPAQSGPSGTWTGGQVGPTTITDASGVATAPVLTANTHAGAWQCDADSVTGSVFTAVFTLANIADTSPPAATTINLSAGSPQSTGTNTPFPTALKALVKDQYGAPFPGASVTFTSPGLSQGSFGGSLTSIIVTDASGYATAPTFTAGAVASSFNVTASTPGVGTSLQFALKSIDPTVPTSIQAASGNSQITNPSTAFGAPLKVRVGNGLGTGVPGISVTFTAPGSGASCTFAGSVSQTVATDASGFATSTIPVANATTGDYNVSAVASGVTLFATTVNFALQNGQSYQAEVCTPVEAPLGGSTTVLGGIGTPVQWTSPNQAVTVGNGSQSAKNKQPYSSSSKSYVMLLTSPASWAAIPDNARITRATIGAWCQWFTAGLGGVSNSVFARWFTQGTLLGGNGPQLPTNTDTYRQTAPISSTLPVGISGAQLKDAASGWGLQAVPVSNQANSGSTQFQVNGVTVSVCYQLPVPPPTYPPPPLLFCTS